MKDTLTIEEAVAAYGLLKENISILEAKTKSLRAIIDQYLSSHPKERTNFGEWDLLCVRTHKLVLDLKRLEKEVGKRVMKRCQVEKEGTQVRVVRAKEIDLEGLAALQKSDE